MRLRTLIAAGMAAVALAAAPAARAEQVTIGTQDLSNLLPPFLVPGCASPCTFFTGDNADTSPVNGVVTSWSYHTESAPGPQYRLRILRGPAALGQTFLAVTSSPIAPIPQANGTFAQTVSLPIATGDRIGVGVTPPPAVGPIYVKTGATLFNTTPGADPADGQTGTPEASTSNRFLGINATVTFCRVPDLRAKKLKRARQLLTEAGCTAKPKRKKSKRKVTRKKRNRVIQQTPAAGETVAPGTAVQLVFRR